MPNRLEKSGQKHSVKAAKSTEKYQMLLVHAAMREWGLKASEPAFRAMVNLGFVDDSKKEVVKNPEGPVHAARKRCSGTADGDEDEGALSQKECPVLGDTWGSSPSASLLELMSDQEPTCLSKVNLRTCGKKHAKTIPQERLMQVFEHVYGLHPNAKVPQLGSYSALLEWLSEKAAQLNCRAHCLKVPFVFDEGGANGSYVVKHANRKWTLKQCSTGRVVELPIDDPNGARKMQLSMHFSETRAHLQDDLVDVAEGRKALMLSCKVVSQGATEMPRQRGRKGPGPSAGEVAERNVVAKGCGSKQVSTQALDAKKAQTCVESHGAVDLATEIEAAAAMLGPCRGSKKARKDVDSSQRPQLPEVIVEDGPDSPTKPSVKQLETWFKPQLAWSR